MRKNRKKLIIALSCAAGAVLLCGGGILLARHSGGAVNVYPASNLTETAGWYSQTESDGSVTADKIQSVYVTETQQVTDVYVEEGQTVSVGDPILAFDTTLSEVELQRQQIKVEQLKLDIEDAQAELKEIGTYRTGSPATYSYSGSNVSSVGSGTAVAVPYERTDGGLGTADDPLIYLWDDSCTFDQSFLIQAAALALKNREAQKTEEPEPTEEPAEPTEEPAEPTEEPVEPTEEPVEPTQEPVEPTEEPVEPTQEPVEPTQEPADETPEPSSTEGSAAADESSAVKYAAATRLSILSGITRAAEQPDGDVYDDPYVYVVFEVRDANTLQGDILRVWETAILLSDDGWSLRFVEPSYDAGDSGADYDDYSDYYMDTAVYYTAAEISQMKADCTQKINDLELQLKLAELELAQLEYELTNGVVYSTIDGVVKTVRDVDEARAENKAVVLVSGGGGYYIKSILGEFDLGLMSVGDTVTVQSWQYDVAVEGTIVDISEYPTEYTYYYYSQGNTNISYYPFTVMVDEDADLREGDYVEMYYQPGIGGMDTDAIYLDPAFVRTENGRSYIYAVGEDGTLEQRFITTGQTLWGYYIEIKDGLTLDDSIAFPYGRSVKDGAKVNYADIDELYSSMYY